jgi:hypothetical protein
MSLVLKIVLAVAGIGLVLFFLDRLALSMERRGWIYYRKNKPSSTSLGNAFLNLQSHLEPGVKQAVEVRQEKKDQHDSGDEPEPGGKARRGRHPRNRNPAKPSHSKETSHE